MTSKMFAFTILCLVQLLSYVQAIPLVARDVFNPTITNPTSSTVWPVGTKQFVEWKTDNIPPPDQITNPRGMVVLGHLGPTGGLNLDLKNPLAKDFPYTQGKVQITVPNVPPRSDYIIVLFGDSGNTSPAFAITQITNGGSSSSSSTTSSRSVSTSSTTTSLSSSEGTKTTAPTPNPTPVPTTTVGLTTTAVDALSSSIATALSQFTSATSTSSTSSPASTATNAPVNSSALRHQFNWVATLASVCTGTLALAFLI